MKKYVVLGVFSAALIFAVSLVPNIIGNSRPKVSLTALKQKTYVEKVTATGTVEEKNKVEQKLDYPVVISEKKVSVGDYVEAGQVLAVVDKGQTVSAVMQTVTSLAESVDAIPDELIAVVAGVSIDQSISQLNLIPETITASASGTVTSIALSEGELFLPTQAAFVISDINNLQVRASVGENDITKIRIGQSVKMTGAAFNGKSYKGTVSKIFPTAKKQMNGLSAETVIDVLVEIEDPNGKIKPGYSVKASITTKEGKMVSVLPYESIAQTDDGQEFVYIYKNGMAVKRNVTSGQEISSGVEIIEGLSPEDVVIYNAQDIKKDNMYIKPGKLKY